jgi:hypothetical protein
MSYRGVADCVLSDGTSMPVSVSLTPEPGQIDGMVGTATAPDLPASYLNAREVTLRFPDGQARRFVVTDVLQGQALMLMSTLD